MTSGVSMAAANRIPWILEHEETRWMKGPCMRFRSKVQISIIPRNTRNTFSFVE
jgi:hypothetical protein